jgi:hypothetical protein
LRQDAVVVADIVQRQAGGHGGAGGGAAIRVEGDVGAAGLAPASRQVSSAIRLDMVPPWTWSENRLELYLFIQNKFVELTKPPGIQPDISDISQFRIGAAAKMATIIIFQYRHEQIFESRRVSGQSAARVRRAMAARRLVSGGFAFGWSRHFVAVSRLGLGRSGDGADGRGIRVPPAHDARADGGGAIGQSRSGRSGVMLAPRVSKGKRGCYAIGSNLADDTRYRREPNLGRDAGLCGVADLHRIQRVERAKAAADCGGGVFPGRHRAWRGDLVRRVVSGRQVGVSRCRGRLAPRA